MCLVSSLPLLHQCNSILLHTPYDAVLSHPCRQCTSTGVYEPLLNLLIPEYCLLYNGSCFLRSYYSVSKYKNTKNYALFSLNRRKTKRRRMHFPFEIKMNSNVLGAAKYRKKIYCNNIIGISHGNFIFVIL